MATEFGLFEAKNKLAELVRRAEAGEDILITRHGKPVARLVAPGLPTEVVERANAAAGRMRQHAKEMKLGAFDWEDEWKGLRDAGRRTLEVGGSSAQRRK
jgi:prevent-host-death family protein